MIETFHPEGQKVPKVHCEHCGELTGSQAYSILLVRNKITREWLFCSLEHLRDWAAPISSVPPSHARSILDTR